MKKLVLLFSLIAISNLHAQQYNPLRPQVNYGSANQYSNYNSYDNSYNYQPNYQTPEYNTYNNSYGTNYPQNSYNNDPAYLDHVQLQEDMASSFNKPHSSGISENLEYYFN